MTRSETRIDDNAQIRALPPIAAFESRTPPLRTLRSQIEAWTRNQFPGSAVQICNLKSEI
jgi:hypothetical protein